jgi:small-conductance mechanosensitive channel
VQQFLTRFDERLAGPVGQWFSAMVIAALAVAAALLVHWVVFRLLRRLARDSESASDNILVEKLARPTRYAAIAVALVIAARSVDSLRAAWETIGGLVMPLLIGWLAITILHALIEVMILRADISVSDNRDARRRRTRLSLFSRIMTFVIVFVTVAMMMLSIPGVRDIGVTLMASAGLAGLAVGAAAQPALKSLIAGFQMALTEPVIVGDAVVIGGEWGWVEEIRTTYVVVKVWDERRLVVPTARFLDEIFQNWTKTTAQLMGTVMLYVDPRSKLDPIREKFMEIVERNERWDRRVKHMQVTDLTRDAIELRFLVSAKDSPTLFDLRCDVREELIQWLAEDMPQAIVQHRILPMAPFDSNAPNGPSGEAITQLGD